jgi:hypothetical protein
MLGFRLGLAVLAGMICLVVATPSMAQDMSADQLASNCRWVREAPIRGDEIRIPEDFESGNCWGYFAAIQELSRFALNDSEERALLICPPPEARLGQIIRVFLNYVDRNPHKGHLPSSQVALEAMWEAFPCKAE